MNRVRARPARKSLDADYLRAHRQDDKRGVLCRAQTHLAASLMERGREQPPDFAPFPS